jgi:hypothetical protein
MVHLGYSFYLNYYWCGALDPKTAKVDSRITAIAKTTKQYTNINPNSVHKYLKMPKYKLKGTFLLQFQTGYING